MPRAEHKSDIDTFKPASELIIDNMVHPNELRSALIDMFTAYESKDKELPCRRHGVIPE